LEFDEVLGLGLARIQEAEAVEVPAQIQQLLDQRQAAREKQAWAEADKLRQQIEAAGFQVIDEESGEQRVKKQ